MALLHVTSFCWCMGLEVGAKFIGVMHLAVSLVMMIVCSIFAEEARSYVGTAEDAGDGLYSAWYRIAVGVAVLSVMHVLLALLLLFSVLKRLSSGLLVWVYIMLLLSAAALLYAVVMAALHGVSGSGSEIFLSFLEAVLFFGVVGYCVLCVYSYYLLLKSSEDMEGPNKTDY
ncbi:uncharacterized protein LOC115446151 [Manduca sexta]|nr:uncharacterized protein LOC115446151 [Manduca sexta]KAG6454266.1 hypothetical protein O3G_MSEX008610 [Manduca sexta]